jgi:hypothetical protein
MYALTKLMTLTISNNRLSALPPGFDQLTQLRLLDASKNALSDASAVFSSMTALTVLDLRENQLQNWPQLPVGAVVALAQLFLGFNSIACIGMTITCIISSCYASLYAGSNCNTAWRLSIQHAMLCKKSSVVHDRCVSTPCLS